VYIVDVVLLMSTL